MKNCQNPECKNPLSGYQKKFCSRRCSAKITTKGRRHSQETKDKISMSLGNIGKYRKISDTCLSCGSPLLKETQLKFCNTSCKGKYYRDEKIKKWLAGELEGNSVGGHAKFVKYYLLEKHNNKCSRCGWGEINPYTNTLPLEVEHIDGNPYNNSPDNVDLVCPNCQALTPTYRGANVGNGRKSYLKKYYYHGEHRERMKE
jgi:hypothetical protein